MPPAAQISVVVPVYNSEDSLPLLVKRLEAALSGLGGFEVILVNDGSRDGSWAVIEGLCRAHPALRGVRLMRNFGQHNALLAGIRLARHDIVVTMDDDLQNPPEEIPKLLAALDRDYDVVYGIPEREQHGLARDFASRFTKWVMKLTLNIKTARDISAFRAFRTRLREGFANFSSNQANLDVLLSWGTSRFTTALVRHEPRTLGRSNYDLRRLLAHAVNMLTGFSILPLRLASYLGFGFTLFGMLVLAWVLGRYVLSGTTVQGFPFLASIIAIFSGVQLFTLGVIGEYIGRIHQRMLAKPCYLIAEEVSQAAAPGAGARFGVSGPGASQAGRKMRARTRARAQARESIQAALRNPQFPGHGSRKSKPDPRN